jgi:hypothetical protein
VPEVEDLRTDTDILTITSEATPLEAQVAIMGLGLKVERVPDNEWLKSFYSEEVVPGEVLVRKINQGNRLFVVLGRQNHFHLKIPETLMQTLSNSSRGAIIPIGFVQGRSVENPNFDKDKFDSQLTKAEREAYRRIRSGEPAPAKDED